MLPDERGEMAGAGGSGADLRDIAARSGVAARGKKERGDDGCATGERSGAEQVGEQRLMGALHGSGLTNFNNRSKQAANFASERITEGGGNGRRAAVINNNERRWRVGSGEIGGEEFADALRDDRDDDAPGSETVGEGKFQIGELTLELFEVSSQSGANGALGANKKGDENEVALASFPPGAHKSVERPSRGVLKFSRWDPIAVLPGDRVNGQALGKSELGSDCPQVAMGGGLEGAVIDERGDHCKKAPSRPLARASV